MVLCCILEAILLAVTTYLIYTRVIKMYWQVYKYNKRGVTIADGAYPCVGNTLLMSAELDK